MRKRTVAAIAASVGIAALAATGVNYASASSSAEMSAPHSAPQSAYQPASSAQSDAAAPFGGDPRQNFDRRDDDRHHRDDHGRVHVNERSYPVEPGLCIPVISSPASSFNIRNESDKTIEFFNGITCDAGAPIATVLPWGSTNVIAGQTVASVGPPAFAAIVGSFRVMDDRNHHNHDNNHDNNNNHR